VLLGTRGIALSAPITDETADLTTLEPWVERVLSILFERDTLALVNVNLPLRPRGLRWTAQSVDQYDGKVVCAVDPMGRDQYWFTVVPIEPRREGTDLWAFDHDMVSITPLRLDLTDHEALRRETAAGTHTAA
jgi:5'-nucleotidase